MTSSPVREMTRAERERRAEELTWELARVDPKVECASHGRQWQQTEYRIREALRENRVEDARKLARGVTPICRRCPVVDMCREWASVSRYCGVAGGHLVRHGRPIKAS